MSYLQNTKITLPTVKDELWLVKKIYSTKNKKSTVSKHKTFCFISGRTKSTYRFANLSRYQIKILLAKGFLTGLKPSSW